MVIPAKLPTHAQACGIGKTGLCDRCPTSASERAAYYGWLRALPLASPPAIVTSTTPAQITVRMSRAGTTIVRVRWSPLLRGTGGAAVARRGEWTSLTVSSAGAYVRPLLRLIRPQCMTTRYNGAPALAGTSGPLVTARYSAVAGVLHKGRAKG
jgi:hypothetical protein